MKNGGAKSHRAPRSESLLNPHSDRFTSFSDTLLIGFCIFMFSLPIVTACAAMSAGIQSLREARVEDGDVRVRRLARIFRDRLVSSWRSHVIIPLGIVALLAANWLGTASMLPGSFVPFAITGALVLVATVYGLRFALVFDPSSGGGVAGRRAYAAMRDDMAGSALLTCAVATALALVIIAPVLSIVVAGPVALAAVAVSFRTLTSKENP